MGMFSKDEEHCDWGTYYAASNESAQEIKQLKEALKVALEFINKYAGPEGCGCEVGSMKHLAQQARAKIKQLVGEV